MRTFGRIDVLLNNAAMAYFNWIEDITDEEWDRDRWEEVDLVFLGQPWPRRDPSDRYMAEDAGAADIIAGGRLQLGISRGSPEQVIDGWQHFGYAPRDGETAAWRRRLGGWTQNSR